MKLLSSKRIGKRSVYSSNISLSNSEIYGYIEFMRYKDLAGSDTKIELIKREIISKLDEPFYILILFGSYVNRTQKKDSDVDILLIVQDGINRFEKRVRNIIEGLNYNIDLNICAIKDFLKMLKQENKLNIANQVREKHIILKGYEEYYILMSKG